MIKPTPRREAAVMKPYDVYWIQDDGRMWLIGAGESKSLQHICFDKVCEMIATSSSVFAMDKNFDTIIKNIQRGRNPHREHWFAILGNQVISVIETIEKKPLKPHKAMYTYIWIEGEKNLNEFCLKRFGERPKFIETIGRVSGKGASAKVHLIYKYPAEDEPQYSGCHEMYFLYMEHASGEYYYSQLQDIMRRPYEEIRTDRAAILRRRG